MTTTVVGVTVGVMVGAGVGVAVGSGIAFTLKKQVELLPDESIATQETLLFPTGIVEPEDGKQFRCTLGQLSLAMAFANVATAVVLLAGTFIVTFEGHVTVGD